MTKSMSKIWRARLLQKYQARYTKEIMEVTPENQKIYDMLSNAGSLVCKRFDLISSLFLEKPSSWTKIDSLRSNMSCYNKFRTALARLGWSDISEEMSNSFLVVTVLIITATYTAAANPPNKAIPPNNANSPNKVDQAADHMFIPGQTLFSYYIPYCMFWPYNTLTFWVSVGLTVFLLPRHASSLFILIALSVLGCCYMLLMVTFSSDIISTTNKYQGGKWYYSIFFMNYTFSLLLAWLVAHQIARYICLKFVKTRRRLLLLISYVSYLFIAIAFLCPAVLFSEIMWRLLFQLYI